MQIPIDVLGRDVAIILPQLYLTILACPCKQTSPLQINVKNDVKAYVKRKSRQLFIICLGLHPPPIVS